MDLLRTNVAIMLNPKAINAKILLLLLIPLPVRNYPVIQVLSSAAVDQVNLQELTTCM